MSNDDLTEFTDIDPERVDGVENPANGLPFLLVKAAVSSALGGAAQQIGYRVLTAE